MSAFVATKALNVPEIERAHIYDLDWRSALSAALAAGEWGAAFGLRRDCLSSEIDSWQNR